MRRILLILTAVSLLTISLPLPRANAFVDPVTIMILAPIAIKAAQIAKPYVLQGLSNLGRHSLLMGQSLLESFLFPLGLLQMTVGLPFGGLSPGMKNLIKGALGFGKFIVRTIMIPGAIFGFSF